jgi:hypothetical protein
VVIASRYLIYSDIVVGSVFDYVLKLDKRVSMDVVINEKVKMLP